MVLKKIIVDSHWKVGAKQVSWLGRVLPRELLKRFRFSQVNSSVCLCALTCEGMFVLSSTYGGQRNSSHISPYHQPCLKVGLFVHYCSLHQLSWYELLGSPQLCFPAHHRCTVKTNTCCWILLYLGSGDLSSSSHACKARLLLIESTPWPPASWVY